MEAPTKEQKLEDRLACYAGNPHSRDLLAERAVLDCMYARGPGHKVSFEYIRSAVDPEWRMSNIRYAVDRLRSFGLIEAWRGWHELSPKARENCEQRKAVVCDEVAACRADIEGGMVEAISHGLHSAGSKGLTRTAISKLVGHRRSKREIDVTLERLVGKDAARSLKTRTPGRSVTTWYMVDAT